MKLEFSGFDEIEKNLNDLERKVNDVSGEVSFEKLFTQEFLSACSEYDDIDAFFNDSGFDCSSAEAFGRIPQSDMDAYVSSKTSYSSWEEMLQAAGEAYMINSLGF